MQGEHLQPVRKVAAGASPLSPQVCLASKSEIGELDLGSDVCSFELGFAIFGEQLVQCRKRGSQADPQHHHQGSRLQQTDLTVDVQIRDLCNVLQARHTGDKFVEFTFRSAADAAVV